MSRPPTPVEDRFWAKVERWGPDACWPYRGHARSDGYGDFNGELAHRVAYRIVKGDPGSYEIQHLSECSSRLCCNPSHLVTTKAPLGGRPATQQADRRGGRGNRREPALGKGPGGAVRHQSPPISTASVPVHVGPARPLN